MFNIETLTNHFGFSVLSTIGLMVVTTIVAFISSGLFKRDGQTKMVLLVWSLYIAAMISMTINLIWPSDYVRVKLDIPQTQDQIQYGTGKEVEIVTPEPRFETLESFEPRGN